MKTLATNANNDFLVTGRSLVFATGINAVLEVCAHAAKAILGEMVFAQDQGMPYFQTVWVGAPTTAPFEAAFRERIAQVPGVTGIDELITEQIGDRMQYSATIVTIYGTGTLNG
jgi:hypothetical protein